MRIATAAGSVILPESEQLVEGHLVGMPCSSEIAQHSFLFVYSSESRWKHAHDLDLLGSVHVPPYKIFILVTPDRQFRHACCYHCLQFDRTIIGAAS